MNAILKTVRPVLTPNNSILAASSEPCGAGEIVEMTGEGYEPTELVIIEAFVSVEIDPGSTACHDKYFYTFRTVLSALDKKSRRR